MATLITMDQAYGHLRRDFPDEIAEADLRLKMDAAEVLVLRFVKRTLAEAQAEPDVAILQAAVLKVLGNLFLFRGDDDVPTGPITPDIELMLTLFRRPTFS